MVLVADLNDDEVVDLIALAWVGQGLAALGYSCEES